MGNAYCCGTESYLEDLDSTICFFYPPPTSPPKQRQESSTPSYTDADLHKTVSTTAASRDSYTCSTKPELSSHFPLDKTEYQWLNKYERGGPVSIVFPSGKHVDCKLIISTLKNTLALTWKDKMRKLPFTDVASLILDTQCENLEPTERWMLTDGGVVGLRLFSSCKAIALRFPSSKDRHLFIDFVQRNCLEVNSRE